MVLGWVMFVVELEVWMQYSRNLRRRWMYSLEKFVGRRAWYLSNVLSLMEGRLFRLRVNVDISCEEGTGCFAMYRKIIWCGLGSL